MPKNQTQQTFASITLEQLHEVLPDFFIPSPPVVKISSFDPRGEVSVSASGVGFEMALGIPPQKKRLILSAWTLKYLDDMYHGTYLAAVKITLLTLLEQHDFTLEYIHQDLSFRLIDSEATLYEAISNIFPISAAKIYELAARKNDTKDSVWILHPQHVSDMMDALSGTLFVFPQQVQDYYYQFQLPYSYWRDAVSEVDKSLFLLCPPDEGGLAFYINEKLELDRQRDEDKFFFRCPREAEDIKEYLKNFMVKIRCDNDLTRVKSYIHTFGYYSQIGNFDLSFLKGAFLNGMLSAGFLFKNIKDNSIVVSVYQSATDSGVSFLENTGQSFSSNGYGYSDKNAKSFSFLSVVEQFSLGSLPNFQYLKLNFDYFDFVVNREKPKLDNLKRLDLRILDINSYQYVKHIDTVLSAAMNLSVLNIAINRHTFVELGLEKVCVFVREFNELKSCYPAVLSLKLTYFPIHFLLESDLLFNFLKKFPNLESIFIELDDFDAAYTAAISEALNGLDFLRGNKAVVFHDFFTVNVISGMISADFFQYEHVKEQHKDKYGDPTKLLYHAHLKRKELQVNSLGAAQENPPRTRLVYADAQFEALFASAAVKNRIELDPPLPKPLVVKSKGENVFSAFDMGELHMLRRQAFYYDKTTRDLLEIQIRPEKFMTKTAIRFTTQALQEYAAPGIKMTVPPLSQGERYSLPYRFIDQDIIHIYVANPDLISKLELHYSDDDDFHQDGFHYLYAKEAISHSFLIHYQFDAHYKAWSDLKASDADAGVTQHILKLVERYTGFPQDLTEEQRRVLQNFENSSEALFDYLEKEEIGGCRHRAHLFARAMAHHHPDIPTKVLASVVHLWCEITYQGKKYYFDLSGADFESIQDLRTQAERDEYDLRQKKAEQVRLEALTQCLKTIGSTATETAASASATPDLVSMALSGPAVYDDFFGIEKRAHISDADKLRDINEAIQQHQTVAVMLTNETDCRSFEAYILRQYGQKAYFSYGLSALMQAESIVKEGASLPTEAVDSSDYDVIVIRLPHMNPTVAGNLNRLMDLKHSERLGSLEGKSIVWVMDRKLGGEVSRYSRMNYVANFYSTTNFSEPMTRQMQMLMSPTPQAAKQDTFAMDFYGLSAGWRRRLLGDLQPQSGAGICFEKGAIQRALEAGANTLLIQNPPDLAEFQDTLTAVLNAGYFRANGQTIKLPAGFKVHIQKENGDLNKLVQVRIVETEDKVPEFDFVYNAENAAYFVQVNQLQNGMPTPMPGWRAQHRNGVLRILATEPIPQHFLNVLCADAARVEVFNVNPANRFRSEHLIQYVSDDLEYLKDKLKALYADAELYDLPGAGYAELMYHVKPDGENRFDYSGSIGTIAEKLKAGGTLILKGDFSADFLKQLEGLLHPSEPYLFEAGQKVVIPEKAKLVLLSNRPVFSFIQSFNVTMPGECIQFFFKDNAPELLPIYLVLQQQKPPIAIGYHQAKKIAAVYAYHQPNNPFTSVLVSHPDFKKIAAITRPYFNVPAVQADSLAEESGRRIAEVKQHLEHEKVVGIYGPTGTGKTTSLCRGFESDPQVRWFVGKESRKGFIDACQEEEKSPSPRQCILFEDEANITEQSEAAEMAYYQNLEADLPFILFEGKKYELGAHARVLLAGNPAQYENRTGKGVFEHIPYVAFDAFNEQIILGFIGEQLASFGFAGDASAIKAASGQIKDLYMKTQSLLERKESFQFVSLRNVKNACARVVVLQEQAGDKLAAVDIVKIGAYREFKGLFQGQTQDESKRLQGELRRELGIKGNVTWAEFKKEKAGQCSEASGLYTSKSARKTRYLLYEFLEMQRKIIAQKGHLPGLLFQGPSGIGKTEVVLDYLKQNCSADEYEVLSANTVAEMMAQLIRCFKAGKYVVIDELNTVPIEKLLNDLLSGNFKGEIADEFGFSVIGLQNPPSHSDRYALSGAELNRFLLTYLSDFMNRELYEIIVRKGVSGAGASYIIGQYLKARSEGEPVNVRSITNGLAALALKGELAWLETLSSSELEGMESHQVETGAANDNEVVIAPETSDGESESSDMTSDSETEISDEFELSGESKQQRRRHLKLGSVIAAIGLIGFGVVTSIMLFAGGGSLAGAIVSSSVGVGLGMTAVGASIATGGIAALVLVVLAVLVVGTVMYRNRNQEWPLLPKIEPESSLGKIAGVTVLNMDRQRRFSLYTERQHHSSDTHKNLKVKSSKTPVQKIQPV